MRVLCALVSLLPLLMGVLLGEIFAESLRADIRTTATTRIMEDWRAQLHDVMDHGVRKPLEEADRDLRSARHIVRWWPPQTRGSSEHTQVFPSMDLAMGMQMPDERRRTMVNGSVYTKTVRSPAEADALAAQIRVRYNGTYVLKAARPTHPSGVAIVVSALRPGKYAYPLVGFDLLVLSPATATSLVHAMMWHDDVTYSPPIASAGYGLADSPQTLLLLIAPVAKPSAAEMKTVLGTDSPTSELHAIYSYHKPGSGSALNVSLVADDAIITFVDVDKLFGAVQDLMRARTLVADTTIVVQDATPLGQFRRVMPRVRAGFSWGDEPEDFEEPHVPCGKGAALWSTNAAGPLAQQDMAALCAQGLSAKATTQLHLSAGGRLWIIHAWSNAMVFDEAVASAVEADQTPTTILVVGHSGGLIVSVLIAGAITYFVLSADRERERGHARAAEAAKFTHETTMSYACHELRNPLHAITATADLLAQDLTKLIQRGLEEHVQAGPTSAGAASAAVAPSSASASAPADSGAGAPGTLNGSGGSVASASATSAVASAAGAGRRGGKGKDAHRQMMVSLSTARGMQADAMTIFKSSKLMQTVVDDMLDYARLRKGNLDIVPTSCSVREVVSDLIESHRAFSEVPLRAVVATDVPARVWLDELRTRQLLANGLSNAAKLTRQGSITVMISIVPQRDRPRFEPRIHAHHLDPSAHTNSDATTATHATVISVHGTVHHLRERNSSQISDSGKHHHRLGSSTHTGSDATTGTHATHTTHTTHASHAHSHSTASSAHHMRGRDSSGVVGEAATLGAEASAAATGRDARMSLMDDGVSTHEEVRDTRAARTHRSGRSSRRPSRLNAGNSKLSGASSIAEAALNPGTLYLLFEVLDTGPGLQGTEPQRLFKPFEQGVAPSKRNVSRSTAGTGLGLAICYQLAPLMGGALGLGDYYTARPSSGHALSPATPSRASPASVRVGYFSVRGRGSVGGSGGAVGAADGFGSDTDKAAPAPTGARFWFTVPLLPANGDEGRRSPGSPASGAGQFPDDGSVSGAADGRPGGGRAQQLRGLRHLERGNGSGGSPRATGSGTVEPDMAVDDIDVEGPDARDGDAGEADVPRGGAGSALAARRQARVAPVDVGADPSKSSGAASRLPLPVVDSVGSAHSSFDGAIGTPSDIHTRISSSPFATAAGGTPAAGAGDKAVLHGTHWLVVDDERVNRSLMARFLRMVGATCAQLEDGDLVEPHLRGSHPHILRTGAGADGGEAKDASARRMDGVLMDIQMMRMQGDEVCAALRARGATFPIIACTGNASAHDVQKYLEAGFNAVLTKPYSHSDLVAVLVQAMYSGLRSPASGPDLLRLQSMGS